MVPLVLEKVLVSQSNKSQNNVQHKQALKYIVQNVQSFSLCQKQSNAIDEGKQNEQITYDFVPSALDDLFEPESCVDETSELDPNLKIIVFWRKHVGFFCENFSQLHKLTDLNGAIVVLIQCKADLCDVVDVPYLVSVQEE